MSDYQSQPFDTRVAEIADLAFRHGMRTVGIPDPESATKESLSAFVAACHVGYGLAQDRLVTALLSLEEFRRAIREKLKDARRERNRELSKIIESFLRELEYQDQVLRSIANGIAWTLLNDQRWLVRRLYQGERPIQLSSSNIKSVIDVANSINQNTRNFSLLSDLTTFVQVGDILSSQGDSDTRYLQLIEVKEGEKNRVILEFLESWSATHCSKLFDEFAKQEGEHAIEQAGQIIKQGVRASGVIEIMNTDRGIARETGGSIRILEPDFEEEYYDEILSALIVDAKENGEAVTVIDECLWIGVFRNEWTLPRAIFQHFIRHAVAKMDECFLPEDPMNMTRDILKKESVPYPIIDLIESVGIAVSRPMFLRRLPPEDILDILARRSLRVYIYIDWNAFFRHASSRDLVIRWQTKKERKQNQASLGFFHPFGKAPVIVSNGNASPLGDGIIVKMIDGLTPTTVVRQLASLASVSVDDFELDEVSSKTTPESGPLSRDSST